MRPPHSLAEIQQVVRRLVTSPEGVAAALAGEGDTGGLRLGAMVRGDRGLSPVERLGVYAHAFFERLRAALGRDFPDLAAALGEDAFHDLVRVYLMIHPPHRPSIRDAGRDLPAFLATDDVAAPFRRRLPCAPDLAAFEWAQTEVFDAPDARPLDRASLANLSPEAWPGLRLSPVPALRLLELRAPVHTLPDGAGPDEAGGLGTRPTRICVWRQDERVRFRELLPPEDEALPAALSGAPFGEVCALVAASVGEEAAAAHAAGFLARWIADGLLLERPA